MNKIMKVSLIIGLIVSPYIFCFSPGPGASIPQPLFLDMNKPECVACIGEFCKPGESGACSACDDTCSRKNEMPISNPAGTNTWE